MRRLALFSLGVVSACAAPCAEHVQPIMMGISISRLFAPLGNGFVFDGVLGTDASNDDPGPGVFYVEPETGRRARLLSEDFVEDYATLRDRVIIQTFSGYLWGTNGSAAGTVRLGAFVDRYRARFPYVDPMQPAEAPPSKLFCAWDYDRRVTEVWRTDGTAGGTVKMLDVDTGEMEPWPILYAGDKLFWVSSAVPDTPFGELWVSNGTEAGTFRVHSFPNQEVYAAGVVNGRVILSVHDIGNGQSVWSTDGTESGTVKLLQVIEDSPNEAAADGEVQVWDNQAILSRYCNGPSCSGWKHWVSDGTPAGTREFHINGVADENWLFGLPLAGGRFVANRFDPGELFSSVRLSTGTATNLFGDRDVSAAYISGGPLGDGRVGLWFAGDIDGVSYDDLVVSDGGFDSATVLACAPAATPLGWGWGVELVTAKHLTFALYSSIGFFYLMRPYDDACPDVFHSRVDTNEDNVVDLAEVMRVISLYNAGGYHCGAGEDGYSPGPGADHDCAVHTLDMAPFDWKINLSELLRAIQMYHWTGYQFCPEQWYEDGFCDVSAG